MQAVRFARSTLRLLAARTLLLAIVALVLRGSPSRAGDETVSQWYRDTPGESAPLFSLATPVGPLAYTPGRGLHVGDTGLTLGGYTDVALERDEGGPATLAVDDLSFFVIWDPTPRLHVFSEHEIEDWLVVDDHGRGGTVDATYVLERLYADYSFSDALHVRGGQFLTPVGRWNVIHAQPLVWTTSRPLATIVPFAPQTTGGMLFGSLFPASGSLTYSLYGQFLNTLASEPQAPQHADRSAGARLEYWSDSGGSVGASYLGFTTQGSWQHLGGLDTFWQRGPMELMGEFVYAGAPHATGNQWGVYLQTALEVWPRLHLVGRYEHFNQRPFQDSEVVPHPDVNLLITGLAYKPVPYAVFKLEYVFADHRAESSPPGFRTSFALLF